MYHKHKMVRGNTELVLRHFFKLLKEITHFKTPFRITWNNRRLLSSGPLGQMQGESPKQVAWVLHTSRKRPTIHCSGWARRQQVSGSGIWLSKRHMPQGSGPNTYLKTSEFHATIFLVCVCVFLTESYFMKHCECLILPSRYVRAAERQGKRRDSGTQRDCVWRGIYTVGAQATKFFISRY